LLCEPSLRKRLCELLVKRGREKELVFFIKGISPDVFDQNTLILIIRALLNEKENCISIDYMNLYLKSSLYTSKAIYKLGETLLKSDKNESALICFCACYRVKPDDSYVMGNICECLLRLGRNEELVRHAQKYIDTYGFNSYLSYMVAKAYVKQENSGMALCYMSRCVDEDPFNHVLLSYTGYVYMMTGDLELALYYTNLSLKFGPKENKKAQKNLIMIKHLQSFCEKEYKEKRQAHIKNTFTI
jgi:tetratricopeptide (TPR) repeat protein